MESNFKRLDQLTNQLPQTMGIEEFVIARAHQQGLAEGEKKGEQKPST